MHNSQRYENNRRYVCAGLESSDFHFLRVLSRRSHTLCMRVSMFRSRSRVGHWLKPTERKCLLRRRSVWPFGLIRNVPERWSSTSSVGSAAGSIEFHRLYAPSARSCLFLDPGSYLEIWRPRTTKMPPYIRVANSGGCMGERQVSRPLSLDNGLFITF